MSQLQKERQGIVNALVGKLEKLDHVPERFVPPAAFIMPADPYIERADSEGFARVKVAFDVWIAIREGDAKVITAALDSEIEAQIDALTTAGYVIESVGQPFIWQRQNGNYPAVVVTVTTIIQLETA